MSGGQMHNVQENSQDMINDIQSLMCQVKYAKNRRKICVFRVKFQILPAHRLNKATKGQRFIF